MDSQGLIGVGTSSCLMQKLPVGERRMRRQQTQDDESKESPRASNTANDRQSIAKADGQTRRPGFGVDWDERRRGSVRECGDADSPGTRPRECISADSTSGCIAEQASSTLRRCEPKQAPICACHPLKALVCFHFARAATFVLMLWLLFRRRGN
ncbi:hypothetical protein IWX47DRAFT_511003 [Phyllosticta citricarpa]